MKNKEDIITFARGSIYSGSFYSTLELKTILGISDWILNKWKNSGLSYNRIGNSFMFEGKDIQRYFREHKIKKVAE